MKIDYKNLIFAIIILCVALSMNSCNLNERFTPAVCTDISKSQDECEYTFKVNNLFSTLIVRDVCDKFKIGDTGVMEPYSRVKTSTVDFPEEFNQVSHNKNKPDTMVCYQENGVYHLGFKH